MHFQGSDSAYEKQLGSSEVRINRNAPNVHLYYICGAFRISMQQQNLVPDIKYQCFDHIFQQIFISPTNKSFGQ